MTTRAPSTDTSAGRARRWLTRALVVAGGAVAATATAWAVSSASASAAPQDGLLTPDMRQSAEQVAPAAPELLPEHAAAQAPKAAKAPKADADASGSGTAVQTAQPEKQPEKPKAWPKGEFALPDGAQVREAGEKVGKAVEKTIKDGVVKPVGRTVGAVAHLVTEPPKADDLWQHLDPGAGELPSLPDDVVGGGSDARGDSHQVDGDRDARHDKDEAAQRDGADAHHGAALPGARLAAQHAGDDLAASEPADLTHPADGTTGDDDGSPAKPRPSPLTHPVQLPGPAPSNGTSGPHVDGPLLGIPAYGQSSFGESMVGYAFSGARNLPAQPGSQPGVTPD